MALPICRWRNWLMVAVVSGTKMKLMAMPFSMVGRMTLAMLTCRLMSLNMKADSAQQRKTKTQQPAQPDFSHQPPDNKVVVKNAARPRGLIA